MRVFFRLCLLFIAFGLTQPRQAQAEVAKPPKMPPEYYEARRHATYGILLTTLGGGLGGLIALVGLEGVSSGNSDTFLVGAGVFGLSLGLGIPMIVQGTREKRRIKREVMKSTSDLQLQLHLTRDHKPALALALTF